MKKLLTTFALLSTITGHAKASSTNEIFNSVTETVYKKLNNLYDTGTKLDPGIALSKIASGRCFKADSQNNSIAAALLISLNVQDVGPIGGNDLFWIGSITVDSGRSPNYFDSPSVTRLDPAFRDIYWMPIEAEDETTSAIQYTVRKFYLKYSSPYIIGKSEFLSGTKVMCYFFNIH